MERRFGALLLALAAASAAGQPANAPASRLQQLLEASDDPPAPALMAPWIERDRQQQSRGRVLNEMEAGTLAFLSGRLKAAEALFADAQQQIETIYADNASAAAARSKFVPEADKDFKGDPYERAMVGYYLGLIDLARGDYDNARAGFRFALLQDTMSASETYQDDMAAVQYLIGWAYWCEGNYASAREEFGRAGAMRAALGPPAEGDNLLLLAEMGNAPRKLQAGQYRSLLQYQAGPAAPERQASFAVGGRQLAGVLAEDLQFQASTRGGAAVDNIRAGKASFRQGAEGIASAAGGVGKVALGAALLSNGKNSRQLAVVGLAASLASAISSSVAGNTETAADDRAWTSLPAVIHLASARHVPDNVPEAGFFSEHGRLLYTQPMLLRRAPDGRCSLAFARAAGAPAQPRASRLAAWPDMAALPGAAPAKAAAAPAPEISVQGQAMLDMVRKMRENSTKENP